MININTHEPAIRLQCSDLLDIFTIWKPAFDERQCANGFHQTVGPGLECLALLKQALNRLLLLQEEIGDDRVSRFGVTFQRVQPVMRGTAIKQE